LIDILKLKIKDKRNEKIMYLVTLLKLFYDKIVIIIVKLNINKFCNFIANIFYVYYRQFYILKKC